MTNMIALIAVVGFVGMVAAQTNEMLPHKLSGRWTARGPNQTFINPIELIFDGDGKPGPVTGRVSWRGVTCGAENEPFTGTWDGQELRMTTTHRANVNVVRLNGQCGDGKTTYVLTRKPGEAGFEGQATSTYSTATPTISVSP